MQDHIQKQILDAFFIVLRPVAKILLRFGIGYREFAEVAKSAFVDVATSEYGIRGRPTNISRVAVMTGLTRKEVRRLRDDLEKDSVAIESKTTPLATILHRWFSESEFLDADGRPSALPFADSSEGPSFTSLVKKYGGDIPPGAMRTELKRVKSIKEDKNGNLVPIRRDVRPATDHDNLCMALLHGAYPLVANIAHNTDPDRKDGTWAMSTAYTAAIRKDDLARLRRICNDRAKESIESFDDLFGAYEKLSDDDIDPSTAVPVAVGVFYYEERSSAGRAVWEGRNSLTK